MTDAVLTRAELSTQGAWLPVPGDAPKLATYRELTGGQADDAKASAPIGFAVVAARRALTRDRPLPAGGVLLGIEAAPGSWAGRAPAEFRCTTTERTDSKGRRIVTARVELRSQRRRGWPTHVEFALRWPEEAGADA